LKRASKTNYFLKILLIDEFLLHFWYIREEEGFGKNKNTGSQWDVREMIGKWNTIFNSLTLLTVSGHVRID
jgi:hypothetical protein